MAPKPHTFNKQKGKYNKFVRKRERTQMLSFNRRKGKASQVKVGFWNARTILTEEKQHTVHDLLDKQGFDVLGLAETWFREDCKEHNFEHKGYSILRNERSGSVRRGGGLMILINLAS